MDTAEDPSDHPPLGRVVVPVDGTRSSTRAVGFATTLAGRLDIPVSIVSVIRDFRRDAEGRVDALKRLLADIPDAVERKVIQARSPSRAIAEESAGGLVCMTTSAEVFDENGIRGSVAEFVTNSATSPVVVLGPRCTGERPISRIVVGIDPAHTQTGLSRWAARLAYQLGVPVTFVHVDTDDGAELGPKVQRLHRRPAESVADRLAAEDPDALLAIGSHGHTGFQRLANGSVGAALLAHATQPVMVLGPNVSADPS